MSKFLTLFAVLLLLASMGEEAQIQNPNTFVDDVDTDSYDVDGCFC